MYKMNIGPHRTRFCPENQDRVVNMANRGSLPLLILTKTVQIEDERATVFQFITYLIL